MTGLVIENRRLTLSAALATAVLSVIFGANFIAIKMSLAGLGSLTAATLRFGASAVIVAVLAKLTGNTLALPRSLIRPMIFFSSVFTIQIGLFYFGLSKTFASRGTLISNLQPFVVLILAHYFIPGDRMTLRRFIGIGLGFIGVSIVFLDDHMLTEKMRTGDLILLISVLLWAANSVYVKRVISSFNIYQLAFYQMIFTVPFLGLAAVLFERPMYTAITPAVMIGLLYQIVIAAVAGWLFWNALYQKYGAVAMSSYLFLQPITGVLLGSAVLGEATSMKVLFIALPLVVVGILLVNGRYSVRHSPQ